MKFRYQNIDQVFPHDFCQDSFYSIFYFQQITTSKLLSCDDDHRIQSIGFGFSTFTWMIDSSFGS